MMRQTCRHIDEWCRSHPLRALLIAVLVMYGVYTIVPDGLERITNGGVLLALIGCSGVVVAIMLLLTEIWTLRGVGFLAYLAGDVLLFTALVLADVLEVGPWWLEPSLINLAKASFTVGVALLLAGLVVWKRSQRRYDGELTSV